MDAGGVGKPRLELFGDGCLRDARGERIVLPKLALVLAAFLIFDRRMPEIRRQEAARFLWPDSPGALTNLRQLLGRVRLLKGNVHLFESDSVSVRLCLSGVGCDLIEFQRLVAKPSFDDAQALIDLYGTGIGVSAGASDEGPFQWLARRSLRMRDAMVAALSDLLDSADARSNRTAAYLLAAQLLKFEPHSEAACRAMMRAHAAAGQTAHVVDTYEQCRAALRAELGAEPAAETTTLFLRLSSLRVGYAATIGSDAAPSAGIAPAAAATTLPRLVVLPPTGRGAGAGVGDLAALLLEDVVVGLCSMKSVRVLAPHTSWRLDAALIDDGAATTRFLIGYVLQTSLLRDGTGVRLVAKLYDTATRSILWAENLGLTAMTSQNCYREIAVAVILALADAIERNELARFAGAESRTAYHWHLIGQKHLRAVDLPEARRAFKAFRSAIKADPEFAPAYSGCARALQRQWLLLARTESDLLDEAEASGLRATQLDYRDARGFRELGHCLLYRRHFDDSLAYHAQAEQLSPQHADIVADHADALAHSGRPAEALAKLNQAIELNPIPPEDYWWHAAGMHFQLRQYVRAIEMVGKMEHPTPALRIAAASWAMLGDKKRAAQCAAQFLKSYPDFRVEHWLALVPNRNSDDTRHYEVALRAAGFK